MYILVTYDVNTTTVEGRRRLRRVAKCCINYGQRVQNSVFECLITEAELIVLRQALLEVIDTSVDSIRIYKLGTKYHQKIEHLGCQTAYDFEGDLIV